ncbi:SDR family oxidoreductase [Devosia sp. LjRoot16]|uniref:NAD(P)-dependent oxidoreductase n=1 Tax=Devosia sp. LjRoot16 TaxID=3342271 RepID=UPI003ECE9FBD
MNILIIGASRGVGRLAVEQALDAGHHVTAFARNPSSLPIHEHLTLAQGDATNDADVRKAVAGHDAVISALGSDHRRGPTQLYSTATTNLIEAMSSADVSRLIVLSNFGVLSESSHHPLTALLVWAVRLGIRHTLADHRLALRYLQRSTLDWTAVRPMALTDGPRTRNYRVVRDGLPNGGTRISSADVADFMLKQLIDSPFKGKLPALAY